MRTIQTTMEWLKRARGCTLIALPWIVLLLCVATVELRAQECVATDNFLDVIRKIESADGRFTWGDHGHSLGAYQMSAGAWLDVSTWRRTRNLPSFDYETSVWDTEVSRSYAADYCSMLYDRLARKLMRAPTAGEVYAAYNMGFSAFARCQFCLDRVNAVTAANCRYIDSVLPDKGFIATEALSISPSWAGVE